MRNFRFAWFAWLTLLLSGCGDPDSPEQRVRSVIAEMEIAAEARDVGDVTQWLAPHYRDAHGNSVDDIARALRGYFIGNQSVHLLTRIQEITFPNEDEARATVLVGMVGRDAAAANAWDLAAELYEFEIALLYLDEEWRVSWAEWRRN